MEPLVCAGGILEFQAGVALGIFRRGDPDSSDEEAKIWFSGYSKCQKYPKNHCSSSYRGVLCFDGLCRGASSRKNRGGHGPGDKGDIRGPCGEAHRNFFDYALFCLKKMPYFSTEIGNLYTKSCKNEREQAK